MTRGSFLSTLIVFMMLLLSSSGFAGEGSDQSQNVTPELRERCVEMLRDASANEEYWVKVQAAEYLLALDYTQGVRKTSEAELQKSGDRRTLNDKASACNILAENGSDSDLPYLISMLDDPDSTVRVEAANAILRIGRRVPSYMSWLDWLVIGIYGFGMIGVGIYYMRRTKSADDYLLGGRTMKPWT
ncbi:MAG: hypothetical protein KAU83_12885, partial [Bacteroidales bacterium]|nr:hypothetical protein [Bacteroidales bacterium]